MSTEPTVQTASEPAVACTDLLARGTPIADAEKEEAAVQGGWMYVIPFETGQAIEREKTFYRGLLKQVCDDPRKTRARRLAESGLMFWDSMQAEKRKRANDPSSATRRTGRVDCKPRRHAGFAAAHG